MATFEKFKVLKVDFRANAQTGEITRFVTLERTQNINLNFKNAVQLEKMPIYESLVGKDVLVQIRTGEMDGRQWVAFDGDGMPIPVPEPLPPITHEVIPNKPSTVSSGKPSVDNPLQRMASNV